MDREVQPENAIVAEPNMKARLVGLGLQPMSLTSTEFGKFIADQIGKWAKVVRAANIKADKLSSSRRHSITFRSANDGNQRNCTLGTVYRCPLSGKPDIEPDIAK
jgi:hypothetical protein